MSDLAGLQQRIVTHGAETPLQWLGFTFPGWPTGTRLLVILTGMKAHMLWYPGQKPQKKP
ncbi:MAG: hypothetical protein ACU0C8_00935 [Roseovarius sp.]